MWVLNPNDVRIENGGYFVENEQLDADLLIHLRGMEPIVGGHGSGLFTRFAGEMGHAQTLKDYAVRRVLLRGPGRLPENGDPEPDPGTGRQFEDPVDGPARRRRRSIAVLNATTEFHPLTWTPVDTALIEAMQANLGALANAAGIPADMIGGDTDTNTYANIESRRMDLYLFTYLHWTARIEAVLDAQLPAGTSLKVDLRGLLRADSAARTAYYTAGLRDGFLTQSTRSATWRICAPLPAEEVVV